MTTRIHPMRDGDLAEETTVRDGSASDRVGLCRSCWHAEVITSSKGSTFYLCTLSATDPRFRRYPALPVVSCTGYQPCP